MRVLATLCAWALIAGGCKPERSVTAPTLVDAGPSAPARAAGDAPDEATPGTDDVQPGEELFAVAPEVITEIDYISPDVRWSAWRWPGETTFHVVYATRDGK